MMEYKLFKEKLLESVNARLSNAELKVMCKNNNVSVEGISFRDENKNCIPFIHLDDLYNLYKATGNIEGIADIVFEIAKTGRKIDVKEFLGTWETAGSKLAVRLINTEWNSDFLKNVPHRDFLDSSLVIYMDFVKNKEGLVSMAIDESLCRFWGISEETLFNTALANLKKEEFSIRDMEEVIQVLRGEDVKPTENDGMNYVMTNKEMQYGARSLLRQELLMNFAEKVNADLFIFPHSVNEVILTPQKEGLTKEELKDMIEIIKVFNKSSTDSLSENMYYFNRETGEISIYSFD